MFDEFLNDTVDLLKRSGGTHQQLRATVQKNKIIMNAGDLVIEPGDFLRRRMSNGAVETYEVVDPGFREAFEDFPRHYQVEVKRLPNAETAKPTPNTHTPAALQPSVKEALLAELVGYEAKLTGIRNRFEESDRAISIAEGDAENLLQYVRELIDLLDSVVGKPNHHSKQLFAYYSAGLQNMYWSPSLESVRNIVSYVKAIQTYIQRPTTVLVQTKNGGMHLAVVADSRLNELRSLKSPQFDFAKLIRLCEELNTAYMHGCYYASAMLTRSILDHVPPVFGMASFGEVANNYGPGGKSFRDAMHGLETAAKKIADGYLHSHIRKRESLPTAQQVNFTQSLDVLLGEIVRIT